MCPGSLRHKCQRLLNNLKQAPAGAWPTCGRSNPDLKRVGPNVFVIHPKHLVQLPLMVSFKHFTLFLPSVFSHVSDLREPYVALGLADVQSIKKPKLC